MPPFVTTTQDSHLPPSILAWTSPWPSSSSSPPWSLPPDYPTAYHIDSAAYRIADAHPHPVHSSSPSSHASSPRFPHSHTGLYQFDHQDEANERIAADDVPLTVTLPAQPAPPRPPTPPVAIKHEDVGSEFIFEGPSSPAVGDSCYTMLCRMTEVPLRATGVPKAMRRLMGVFRLDPFAYDNTPPRPSHSGLDYAGDKIGPLAECGREFEFQLGEDTNPDEVKPVMDEECGSEERLSSPEDSPTRLGQEELEESRDMDTQWNTAPHETPYVSISDEQRSFETVPTPVQSLEWLRYNTGSSDGSNYSESPPMRTMEPSEVYLSLSSQEMQMASASDVNRDFYTPRLRTYPASHSLRLPPPTPSPQYICEPHIREHDGYPDEPEPTSGGHWYNKGISLSAVYHKVVDANSLSSNASLSLPLAPSSTTISSLAHATKYRSSSTLIGGTLGHAVYPSSLHPHS